MRPRIAHQAEVAAGYATAHQLPNRVDSRRLPSLLGTSWAFVARRTEVMVPHFKTSEAGANPALSTASTPKVEAADTHPWSMCHVKNLTERKCRTPGHRAP
jgi:hypothetical protein